MIPERSGRTLPRVDGWSLGAALIAALMLLPVLSVAWLALRPGEENVWPHLLATTLPRYVANTLVLMAGVGALSAVVGTGAAWLVTMYRFPGRGWLQWALMAGAVFLPYLGVLLANQVDETGRRTPAPTDASDAPQLTSGPEPDYVEGVVIDDDEEVVPAAA